MAAGIVLGLSLHDLRQTHINPVGKFAVRGDAVFKVMGFHALPGLICLVLAFVLVVHLFRKRRPEGLPAALSGLVTLGFAVAAIATTSPQCGDELIMLMIFLSPVLGGCGFLLLIASLVLLLSSLLCRSQPTLPVKWVCDRCGYTLAGDSSGACPKCGVAVPDGLQAAPARMTGECRSIVIKRQVWTGTAAALLGVFALASLLVSRVRPWPPWTLPFAKSAHPIGRRVSDLVTVTVAPWWIYSRAAVVLLVGACGLLLRQRWGAWLCGICCAGSILLAATDFSLLLAGQGFVHLLCSDRLTESVAVQSAWGILPPIALAAWLRRKPIKEQIAHWL